MTQGLHQELSWQGQEHNVGMNRSDRNIGRDSLKGGYSKFVQRCANDDVEMSVFIVAELSNLSRLFLHGDGTEGTDYSLVPGRSSVVHLVLFSRSFLFFCLLALNFSDPRWTPLSEHISTQTSTAMVVCFDK